MAKYRHRVFEMYELRDEAIQAMTPKTQRAATEPTAPESWTFACLAVSRAAGVIDVQFKAPGTIDDAAAGTLRDDLTRLAELLGRDSKVLLDFSDVELFTAAAISALAQFSRSLQTKGSRIVLCCLAPAIRESFFVTG